VVWTFLLDTGANVNSIRSDLVEQHHLERLFSAKDPRMVGLGGVGGVSAPGDIVLLGDCQLTGLPGNQSNAIFMKNLTAASLPLASPVGQGLLGLQFFMSFKGVMFDWHGVPERKEPPSVGFLFTDDVVQMLRENMTACVPLRPWGLTGEVMIDLTVNKGDGSGGVDLPALLDTGAPISIICKDAAKRAGIATVQKKSNLKAGYDYLTIGGVDGKPMQLYRTQEKVSIQASGKDSSQVAQFGTGYVFVGELPGLARIAQMVAQDVDPPSMIVGRDVLASSQCMLLQLSKGEVWFENRHHREQ